MKITRYPQSCVLIESNQKKILIDPGILKFEESFLEDWKQVDLVLVTHKHADHCHAEVISEALNNNAKLYTSSEVLNTYPELNGNAVKIGNTFEADGFKIEVVKAVHGYIPPLRGEKEIKENIGFIITVENKRVYITSDTVCFKNDYKCDIVVLPISNHGLTMGPFEAALFTKETGASLALPVHDDNPAYPADQKSVEENFSKLEINYKKLNTKDGISI